MKANLTELIVSQDYYQILDWAKSLSDEKRYTTIEILKNLDPDEVIDEPRPKNYSQKYADKYFRMVSIKTFMTICCVRSKKDIHLTVPDRSGNESAVHTYLCRPEFGIAPLVAYFELYPPDYLSQIVEQNSKQREWNNDFQLLWKLYENGYVTFNEEIFVRSLFIIPMFNRNTMEDVKFLAEHPEAIHSVLLQFYKYEIPVLDISKWQAKKEFCCKKCTEYWDEVFAELLTKGVLKDRTIIRDLLSTLTYNWKKRHLEWHIRLLKLFNATREEYLANQDYLLNALSTHNNSVCNFVIYTVETFYKEEAFDVETFLQNLHNLFVKENSNKAIRTALDITAYIMENNPTLRKYANTISNALIQPSDQIQEKAALLLKKLLNKDDLKKTIELFASSLKQKARDILTVEQEKIEESLISTLKNAPVPYPATWEDFLFHIGKTISSLNAIDIDIMYNGFIEFQDQLQDNYFTQLKPYIKKVAKSNANEELLVYISEFFESYITFDKKYKISNPEFIKFGINPSPFMRNRNKWILDKIKRSSWLPLLSTPTHYPFYIHPDILVTRLSQYEKAGEPVEMEDLIIACNRILKIQITAEVKKQAEKLNGYYASAIQYLLGISGQITFDKETLPLWTQISRTKDANGTFKEFEKSEAKSFPTVVNPFFISYTLMYNSMELDDRWNNAHTRQKEKTPYPYPYFYTAYNSHKSNSKAGFLYWVSLAPHYIDAILLIDLPWSCTKNELKAFEYCSYPLQYLIENQIQVHHSGWLYIAFCLIFDKKTSRTLATEYISMAFNLGFINKEYLAESLSDMLMSHFTPVDRLIEYFDQMNPDHIKTFQLLIIEKCIRKVEINNLPVNLKKLVASYYDLNNSLNKEPDKEIDLMINTIKKQSRTFSY